EQNSQEALIKLQQIKKSKSKPFFIWELYFNDVFNRQNPGFDIVIGNPPYIRIQKLDPVISQYIKKRFVVAKGKFDIYTLFYEIGFYILRNSGTITYISSNSFLMQDFGEELRNYLSKNNFAQKILDFGHNQVFENASTYTLIFLGKKEKLKYIEYNKAYYLGNNSDFDFKKIQFTRSTDYGVNFKWENILRDDLISKIYANSKILENYAYTRSPLFTGMDDLLLKENNIDNKYICETIWREIIKPKEIKKHHILVSKQKVFFPYQLINDKFVLINESEFRQKYPLTYDYLFKFKSELLNRKDSGKNFIELGKPWYALMRVGEPSDYNLNKIITPSVINKSNFAFDNSKRIYPTGGTYGLIPKNNAMSLKFIYALLNSKLYLYIVMLMATPKRGGYVAISARNIKQLPIKDINSVKQKPFIELVDKILNITKDEDYLENKSKQQKVKQLESEIDKLVYKLYELTTEEIKIVEGIN
ncbi:MAG: TaqI-like C-terminal specificity domain-containing protein, partial [Candidatus ainarchaeum sp.]|nr:TaqI-like C-terminal specificity domain-containing protein [Candidatus ainarchaeum sp.]